MKKSQEYRKNKIINSKENDRDNELLTQKIEALAEEYTSHLKIKIAERKEEMKQDDTSHYLGAYKG